MSEVTRWRHPDGEEAPQYDGVRGVFKVALDDDGTIDHPEGVDPDVLRERGYEPVETVDGEPAGDELTAGGVELDGKDHGELKAIAEGLGIADDIDLRSKASIREGIRDHTEADDGE